MYGCFFLMIRRPPRSTLFPTRRSSDLPTATHDVSGDFRSDIIWRQSGSGAAAVWLMNGPQVTTAATLGVVATSDRKSTRLNSSHANISYAVFCLKKKIYIFLSHFLPFF